MSSPPRYEKLAPRPSVSLDELERQPLVAEGDGAAGSSASSSTRPVQPPMPWAEGEIRHPAVYQLRPPAHLRRRGLGGTASSVLGRSREETLAIARRAFPTALKDVDDDRIVLWIPAEDPRGSTPHQWVRLSPDWWAVQFAPRPPPPANLAAGLLGALFAPQGDELWWPRHVKVEIELTEEEAQQENVHYMSFVAALFFVAAVLMYVFGAFSDSHSGGEA